MFLGPNTGRTHSAWWDITAKSLYDITEHYNPGFDPRKIWYYGCHCIMVDETGNPLVTRGVGKPVDELDSICKLYKECIKNNDTVL